MQVLHQRRYIAVVVEDTVQFYGKPTLIGPTSDPIWTVTDSKQS